jgi:hypothetical protein
MKHATMLRTLPAAVAIAGALLAGPARADWDWNQDTWAQGQAVSVQLKVDGRAAPLYLSPRGDARRYFEAFAGRNYAVVLRNNTGQRLGVLIAVDGLNVVSGLRSQLSPSEQMYVLGPWETTTIRGWRTSLDDVQRFVFVDEKRSYAERTGQANGDMGWIRVLSFREQRLAWLPRPRYILEDRSSRELQDMGDKARRNEAPQAAPPASAAPAPSGSMQEDAAPPVAMGELKAGRKMAADGLAQNESGGSFPGTGWGEHRSDPVQRVDFTAERRATDTLNFRYEYASGLQALGIYRNRDRLRDRDNGELGFAKPPRW